MSFRPPQTISGAGSGQNAFNVLEYELMAERADSLGRAGLKAEAALARLAEADTHSRPSALAEAADAVYWLFIQREICGLRNGADVVKRYGIPGAVIARLGVRHGP